MLHEHQIRHAIKSRVWIMIPAFLLGITALLGYLFVLGNFRETAIQFAGQTLGSTFAEFIPGALVLPGIGIFLIPCVVAEKYLLRFNIACPLCSADLMRVTRQVIATRCCHECHGRIVSGRRRHSAAAYKRFQKRESFRLLGYWFWAWPLLGAFVLAWHAFDSSALERCQNFLFAPGLIGAAAGGWTALRTRSRRYWLPTIASAVIFGIGVATFWRTIS